MEEQILPTDDILELLNEAESLKSEFDDFDAIEVAEFARDHADKRGLNSMREAYLFKKQLEEPLNDRNIHKRIDLSLSEGRGMQEEEPATGFSQGVYNRLHNISDNNPSGINRENLSNKMSEFLKVKMAERG